MTKYAIGFLVIIGVFLPSLLFAHTSDERYVDGYVIDLSTAPVAPWVGEKTGMSFVFFDPQNRRATTTVVSATLVFDALMRANKKPPEVIYTSKEFPVVNGGFVTDYIFKEEGTYDMHIDFVDTAGMKHETGFRKQVRSGEVGGGGIPANTFFMTTIFVALLSFTSGRLWKAKT